LTSDPIYHNSYLTPDSWLEDSIDAHGPYSLNRIQPETFTSIEFSDFESTMLQILHSPNYDSPGDEVISKVRKLAASFPSSTRFYKLNLEHDRSKFEAEDFVMDFEWSFFLYEFVELVAVNVERKQLSIMVFGLD
jgi:hypothetical protein